MQRTQLVLSARPTSRKKVLFLFCTMGQRVIGMVKARRKHFYMPCFRLLIEEELRLGQTSTEDGGNERESGPELPILSRSLRGHILAHLKERSPVVFLRNKSEVDDGC